jgi:Spx/MgsR family transcriptional regulator
MKLKLYTYPTCITSKKARAWLQERGADFQEVDVKSGLAVGQLDKLIGKLDHTQFFNPRNPVYRDRKIKTDPPPRAECLEILAAEPKAIRRPMLQKGRTIALGFKPAEYEELI